MSGEYHSETPLAGPISGHHAPAIYCLFKKIEYLDTTGAITHILDRLEKRQFIERVRDTRDRRKVLIRVRPESLEPVAPKYDEIGKAYMNLADRYGDKELQLIFDYMESASEISKRELANLLTANGSRSSHVKSRP